MSFIVRGLALAALGTCLAAGRLPAQDAAAPWLLEAVRGGFCTDFLIHPDSLRLAPRTGTSLAPLSASSAPEPVLARLVEGEPQYGAWIPSRLCLAHVGTIWAGGRRYRDDDRLQGLLFWRLGAEDDPGARTILFATSGSLLRRTGLSDLAEVETFESDFQVDSLSGTSLSRSRIDETWLRWDGTVLPADSAADLESRWRLLTPPALPTVITLKLPGNRGGRMSGTLTVTGDGLLAVLLQSSPIRWASTWLATERGSVEVGHLE